MKIKSGALVRFLLILGILLSLTGSYTREVQAAGTCTWQGTTTDWYEPSNWSGCLDGGGSPTFPNDTHDVVIPAYQVTYPVLTGYQDQIDMNSLTIEANAQITIDNQTIFWAHQVDNYGTIQYEEVTGHNLRIQAPFNNYGLADSTSEGALILYESGTHTGSFTGRQLSFYKSSTEKINDFQAGSSVTVAVLMVQEYHSVNFNGNVSSEMTYIRSNSVVDISSSQSADLGTINLQGGEVIVSAYEIATGQTFSGTGTLQTNLTNAGTISPGNSPGTLTIDGDYSQVSSGSLSIELGGTTANTDYDQLIVTGAAELDGTLDVSLIDEFTPSLGDSFTILTYASHIGSFETMNLPALDPDLVWEVAYENTAVVMTVSKGIGSISGTVNYSGEEGYQPVTIGLFTDPNSAPVDMVDVSSTTGAYPYEITGISKGIYYVAALMDLDDNNQPDPGEPYEWYGSPTAIAISDGTPDHTNIDIQLGSELFPAYMPLILR